jgi:ribonuclease T2
MATLRSVFLSALVLALAGVSAAPATAQRYDNRADRYDRYDNDNERSRGGGRNVAGEFDYYALVLSWSPTHCATLQRNDYEPQCHRKDGRRYNFVLHGLWPQYERGFPGECQIGRRPFVPDDVIDDVMDVMPSKPLIIHEYRKHGTCSGLDPARYFEISERLFRTIKIPQRYVNPFEQQSVTPATMVDEFLTENPQLKRDMLVVSCDGSRNRLKDVRICMNRDGQPRTCGKNENQRRLCSADTMYVPPVRSSAAGRTDGSDRGPQRDDVRERNDPRDGRDGGRQRGDNPLPGPRIDRDERSL